MMKHHELAVPARVGPKWARIGFTREAMEQIRLARRLILAHGFKTITLKAPEEAEWRGEPDEVGEMSDTVVIVSATGFRLRAVGGFDGGETTYTSEECPLGSPETEASH